VESPFFEDGGDLFIAQLGGTTPGSKAGAGTFNVAVSSTVTNTAANTDVHHSLMDRLEMERMEFKSEDVRSNTVIVTVDEFEGDFWGFLKDEETSLEERVQYTVAMKGLLLQTQWQPSGDVAVGGQGDEDARLVSASIRTVSVKMEERGLGAQRVGGNTSRKFGEGETWSTDLLSIASDATSSKQGSCVRCDATFRSKQDLPGSHGTEDISKKSLLELDICNTKVFMHSLAVKKLQSLVEQCSKELSAEMVRCTVCQEMIGIECVIDHKCATSPSRAPPRKVSPGKRGVDDTDLLDKHEGDGSGSANEEDPDLLDGATGGGLPDPAAAAASPWVLWDDFLVKVSFTHTVVKVPLHVALDSSPEDNKQICNLRVQDILFMNYQQGAIDGGLRAAVWLFPMALASFKYSMQHGTMPPQLVFPRSLSLSMRGIDAVLWDPDGAAKFEGLVSSLRLELSLLADEDMRLPPSQASTAADTFFALGDRPGSGIEHGGGQSYDAYPLMVTGFLAMEDVRVIVNQHFIKTAKSSPAYIDDIEPYGLPFYLMGLAHIERCLIIVEGPKDMSLNKDGEHVASSDPSCTRERVHTLQNEYECSTVDISVDNHVEHVQFSVSTTGWRMSESMFPQFRCLPTVDPRAPPLQPAAIFVHSGEGAQGGGVASSDTKMEVVPNNRRTSFSSDNSAFEARFTTDHASISIDSNSCGGGEGPNDREDDCHGHEAGDDSDTDHAEAEVGSSSSDGASATGETYVSPQSTEDLAMEVADLKTELTAMTDAIELALSLMSVEAAKGINTRAEVLNCLQGARDTLLEKQKQAVEDATSPRLIAIEGDSTTDGVDAVGVPSGVVAETDHSSGETMKSRDCQGRATITSSLAPSYSNGGSLRSAANNNKSPPQLHSGSRISMPATATSPHPGTTAVDAETDTAARPFLEFFKSPGGSDDDDGLLDEPAFEMQHICTNSIAFAFLVAANSNRELELGSSGGGRDSRRRKLRSRPGIDGLKSLHDRHCFRLYPTGNSSAYACGEDLPPNSTPAVSGRASDIPMTSTDNCSGSVQTETTKMEVGGQHASSSFVFNIEWARPNENCIDGRQLHDFQQAFEHGNLLFMSQSEPDIRIRTFLRSILVDSEAPALSRCLVDRLQFSLRSRNGSAAGPNAKLSMVLADALSSRHGSGTKNWALHQHTSTHHPSCPFGFGRYLERLRCQDDWGSGLLPAAGRLIPPDMPEGSDDKHAAEGDGAAYFNVIFHDGSFGLQFGSFTGPLRVSACTEPSSNNVYACAQVKIGDILLSINGKDVASGWNTSDEALRCFADAARPALLNFSRDKAEGAWFLQLLFFCRCL
jgi:hypothetical protein